MSAIEVWTWIAIGVLTVGSLAVFVWFLRDLMRMARAGEADGTGGPGAPPREEA